MKLLYKPLLSFGVPLLILSACSPSLKLGNYDDPYENVNRKSHEINKTIDKNFLRPSSQIYSKFLGEKPRNAVSNFSENWGLPKDLVNYTLQGDIGNASKTTGQFLINSTIGIAGVFDPSEKFGINARGTDFGETMHRWGVSEGDYVEIIFLGPSTERDAVGKVADLVLDPVGFILNSWQSGLRSTANVGNVLGNRAALGSTIDSVLYDSADSYSQTKLAYLQGRRFRLNPEISEVYSDPYVEMNE
jgi:phospholipid-binding lipoprotein MlaA